MKKGLTILSVFILIVLIVAIYFTFFFYYGADDLNDYFAKQEKCAKTKFVNYAEETTWKYIVKGKEDGLCEVEVVALEIKEGASDRIVLQGKSMTCLVSLDTDKTPEKDLARCHGELKEELQNLIIQELHKYIVDNVGEIGEALNKVI